MAKTREQKPLNPLSDFFKRLDGKRLLESDARVARIGAFFADLYDDKVIVKAIAADGHRVQLGKLGARIEDVDRVNGIWYIQTDFPHKIMHINDKDMVLLKEQNNVKIPNFEFWVAKSIGYNNFGPFIEQGIKHDYIVAKYETNSRVMWGYGKTIEEACKNIETRLYNEYKQVAHHIASNFKTNQK